MYILPGYVDFYEDNGVIYVTSKLHCNKVKLSAPEIIDEFKSVIRCGGCSSISTPLSKFLHEQELLVNKDEIETAITELRKVMNDTLLLTIMPTEGCNFRCPYCYENHVPISLTRKKLDQLQKYIADQVSQFRYVNIGWFGGEPTLCKDIVIETCELVQELQKNNDFVFTSRMTTNGYLLGAVDFVKYYQAGITSYQITLDGWDHDKTRPHVTGKGTLQRILDNLTAISALPQKEYDYHITLRHNILPGDEEFSWYDYLHSLFGGDDRFSVLVRPVSDWGGETVKSMDILQGDGIDNLMRKHVDYLHKIGMSCENGKKGILSKICYANYPHGMVFRANGKIEKCTICLDHPKNLLGRLDPEQGVVLDDAVNQLWTQSSLKPECYHCTDLLSCLNMKCRMSAIIHGTDVSSLRCDHEDLF